MNNLPVSEVFSSIQGEGMTSGIPSVFLRLGGCNLMCGGQGTQYDKELHNGAQWRCDTIEVWMQAQMKEFKDVVSGIHLENLKRGFHLIITGGEPLMQQEKIIAYLSWLKQEHDLIPFVEIETNGTIMPSNKFTFCISQFNISPKLSNSGNEKSVRYKPEVIKKIASLKNTAIQFKYVIANKTDLQEVLNDFVVLHGLELTTLMPAGENDKLLQQTRELVAELCIENKIRYTDRQHIVIWNQKTGV